MLAKILVLELEEVWQGLESDWYGGNLKSGGF